MVKKIKKTTRKKMASKTKGKHPKKTAKKVTKKKNTSKVKKIKQKKKGAKKRAIPKKKTKRASKKDADHFQTVTIINEKLAQLEKQALKAYECVQAIKKRSAPDWKEWIDKLSTQDWLALADAQRGRIRLEIKHLSNEILSKIHGANILTNKDSILDDAKNNLESIVNQVENGDLVNKAIDTAIHTKDGLLAFLNIPTHEEMVSLQRKLSRIERRMTRLRSR